MTFVSFTFLIFAAATVLLYFLLPKKIRWTVLLAASLVFYLVNSRWLLLALVACTLVTYVTGLCLATVNEGCAEQLAREDLSREERKAVKDGAKKRGKALLTAGILLDLGMLLYLKYFNFFADNANRILSAAGIGFQIPGHKFLLPLGISFYTLQAISYMTDVYRGKCEADRNLAKFLLYMSFFPQIVQGPIPRYGKLAGQLYEGHSFDYDRLCRGLQLMLWGWFKKMVIADRADIPVTYLFYHYTRFEGPIVFFGAALYGIQVYADFSGGMDVARGICEILGIELDLNFRQPYFSTSVEEFWRRWHITLGAWMRDYVFYPLSLSKAFVSLGRRARKLLGTFIGNRLPSLLAMFIVYLLVGVWHGSSWKYAAYGIWNGLFIMSGILLDEFYGKAREKAGIDPDAAGWRLFQMVRTFAIISVGRIISRAQSFRCALEMLGRMLTHWWDLSFLLDGTLRKLGLDQANWFVLFLGTLLLLIVDLLHEKDVRIRDSLSREFVVIRWFVCIAAVLAILIFGIYGPAYSAASFIYEQF